MAVGTQAYVVRDGERVPVDIKDDQFTLYRKTVPTLAIAMNEPFIVDTLEGKEMAGVPGDYLCKGNAGELYPCGGDIFRSTHEQVGSGALVALIADRYIDFVEEGERTEDVVLRILSDPRVHQALSQE
jgi:hypothetical protein